ncbi:lipid droplet-regulating VLDL assembly factor AUP1 homolog [Parasteatoda tepidariorum]|nr:lipid droplet-regulating VLDL assembly factor AUP1 homolog [Parasteatoda tepidariorum]
MSEVFGVNINMNMSSIGISRESEKVKENVISLEDLFFTSRILKRPQVYKALLYFPFGLVLLAFRIAVCFLGVIVLSLLPKTSHTRSFLLKGLCKILGFVIEVDDKYLDDSSKLLVSNHVSILDRLAVNVMVPCNTVSKDFHIRNIDSLWFWKDDVRYPRNLSDDAVSALRTYIDSSSIRVLCFPEETTTNGKIGLLKFHPGICTLSSSVQPVLIWVSISSFMKISPSVIGSTVFGDLVWAFFLPCISFTLKVLPSIIKHPEESIEDYSKRIQETMAKSLESSPTIYTSSDKDELIKRLKTSALPASSCPASSQVNVPALGLQSSDQDILNMQCTQDLSMNTAAASFGKTPKQRMLSYQERRAKLIEAARIKYLQKRCKIVKEN